MSDGNLRGPIVDPLVGNVVLHIRGVEKPPAIMITWSRPGEPDSIAGNWEIDSRDCAERIIGAIKFLAPLVWPEETQ